MGASARKDRHCSAKKETPQAKTPQFLNGKAGAMTTYTSIDFGEGLEMGVSGPPLSEGSMPALFYFALSAEDSLCLRPYNRPAEYLANRLLRVFSVTLPFHKTSGEPQEALTHWVSSFAEGRNILAPFFEAVIKVIEKIAHLGYAAADQIGVAGLSRGAFIATHVAARCSLIKHILGFAPLTRLSKSRTFAESVRHSFLDALDIHHLISSLIGKNLRFYIGNRDHLVGTGSCFSFIEQLADASYEAKIRSPQAELIIFPSIGFLGHGTPPEIFDQGAEWIGQKLSVANG